MRRTAIALTTLAIATTATLTACGGDKGGTDSKTSAPSAATSSAPAAAPSKAAVPDAEAKLGIPPKPDAVKQAAYIRALTAIDPDIVHGKEDKAVSRGRNECRSIHDSPKDRAKQVELANLRFTSPTHPQGFGPTKAAKIRDVVHEHLCPTF